MRLSPHVPGLFVTGTDTEVGKTYVSSLLAAHLRRVGRRVGVYKPVASGCRTEGGKLVSDDAVQLWEAAGGPRTLEEVCPQRFAPPLAPHRAAAWEGTAVDAGRLRTGLTPWLQGSDTVLVEGAGGLLSPLTETVSNAELAADFGFPLLVVAANRLGVLNHVRLTLRVATGAPYHLKIAAVVLNDHVAPEAEDDPSRQANLDDLRRLCPEYPVLSVPHGAASLPEEIPWERWGLAE